MGGLQRSAKVLLELCPENTLGGRFERDGCLEN
jgi:hypothetical protein